MHTYSVRNTHTRGLTHCSRSGCSRGGGVVDVVVVVVLVVAWREAKVREQGVTSSGGKRWSCGVGGRGGGGGGTMDE